MTTTLSQTPLQAHPAQIKLDKDNSERCALASSSLSLFLLLSDIWKLLRELWKSALSYLDELPESSLLSHSESSSPSWELTLSPRGRGEQCISKPSDSLCTLCMLFTNLGWGWSYLSFTSSSLSCSATVSHLDSALAETERGEMSRRTGRTVKCKTAHLDLIYLEETSLCHLSSPTLTKAL